MGTELGLPDDWMYWLVFIVLGLWLKRRGGIGS